LTETNTEPCVFRNSRAVTRMVQFSGVVGAGLGLIFFVLGLIKVWRTPESTGQHILGFFGVLFAFCVMIALGLYMWGQGDSMSFFQASFDPDGLRFRLGSEKKPDVTLFPWDAIAAVNYKRVINTQYASVVAGDGTTVEWSSYTFFRPKKLAKEIAARAGQQLKDMD
jgi:hypothetical protein